MPRLPRFSPLFVHTAGWLLAGGLLWNALLYYLIAAHTAVVHPPSSDYYKFYLSAERWLSGKSPYWLIPLPDSPAPDPNGPLTLGGAIPGLAPNLNPPIFLALIIPLMKLPYGYAWCTWALVSLACSWLSVWLVAGILGLRWAERALVTALAGAALHAYYPRYIDFAMGQVGSLLMLPLTLGWLALRRGHAARSGVWWGLAISLKPFLILLLPALVVARQWRAAGFLGLTVGALGLVGLAWMGWQVHEDYRLVAGHVIWTTSNWNASAVGFIDRAFSGFPTPFSPPVDLARKALLGLMSVVVGGPVLWLIHKGRGQAQRQQADMLVTLMVPTVILVSPLGWLYYLPWLLLPLTVCWLERGRLPYGVWWAVVFVAVLAVACVPTDIKAIPTPLNPTRWWGEDAMYAYVLVACWGIGVALVWLQAGRFALPSELASSIRGQQTIGK